jgi:beta-lactam-binding protein with PASTA domain
MLVLVTMRRWSTLLVVVAAASSLLGALPAAGKRVTPSTASIVVPRVVGMRMDAATRTLKARGFRVFLNCGAGYDCTATHQLYVSAQAPRAGARFPARTVITIYGALR